MLGRGRRWGKELFEETIGVEIYAKKIGRVHQLLTLWGHQLDWKIVLFDWPKVKG